MQNTSSSPHNYVLAHGSWHGGWCWQPVAERLREAGHQVFTPSFTGLGDRSHLLSEDITIDTFIEDLIQVIEAESLDDVILVGHSFAGVAITGVADRLASRLAHLVYFDAVVLPNGAHSFSNYPPNEVESRIAAAGKATGGLAVPVPDPLPAAWGLDEGSKIYEWVRSQLTPHPLRSYTTALRLNHAIGNGVPKTYIHCTQPSMSLLKASRELVQSQDGWNWVELAAGHEAHITHPEMIAKLLLEIHC